MLLEWLDEFLCVARYMNISKAAQKLNVSQSTLSRHMKQLENVIGFPLLSHESNYIALTRSGRMFADDVEPIRESLQDLITRCKSSSNELDITLTVHEHPYMDNSISDYLHLLDSVSIKLGRARIKYRTLYRQSLLNALKDRTLDIGFFYSRADSIASLENEFQVRFLNNISFGIWVDKENSTFSDKEIVGIKDLEAVSILTPNDTYHPFRNALIASFENEEIGLPRFKIVNTETRSEFYREAHSDAVFILPASMNINPSLVYRNDLRFIPLDESFQLGAYAICRKEDGFFSDIDEL